MINSLIIICLVVLNSVVCDIEKQYSDLNTTDIELKNISTDTSIDNDTLKIEDELHSFNSNDDNLNETYLLNTTNITNPNFEPIVIKTVVTTTLEPTTTKLTIEQKVTDELTTVFITSNDNFNSTETSSTIENSPKNTIKNEPTILDDHPTNRIFGLFNQSINNDSIIKQQSNEDYKHVQTEEIVTENMETKIEGSTAEYHKPKSFGIQNNISLLLFNFILIIPFVVMVIH